MKKLLFLTIACAYSISMYAMELTDSGEDVMISMKCPIPVATKSDKPARTIELLERKKNELSESLRKADNEYFKIDKQARYAYDPSVDKDNPYQAQAKIIYGEYRVQRTNILAELTKLEEQMKTTKYEWFMNRIKHSKPIELQDALKYAVGQYNRSPEAWHLKYCLFTREQKMKLIAYAQTIQAKRNTEIHFSKGAKIFEGKKPNPKILKKYTKACYVTLLMQEFKNMTVADQQKGSRYFEYQTNP